MEPRISICGVMEYPCSGACGDWIREHEAVWVHKDGTYAATGGRPFCPECAPSGATSVASAA